jgi:DNA-binding transcriptional LysR family regulator
MIRELKTLVAVAREGTFAAAGAKIGLTQAAVSAQMRRLEAEFGAALFDRVGRAARLNPHGAQILLRAQELIRLYETLGAAPPGEAAPVPVTIGAIATTQRGLLPDALAKFHRAVPAARVRVVPGVSMDLLDQVDRGDLDFAVMIRPPFALQSDLRWVEMLREPFRLIVPRGVKGGDWAAILATRPFIRYDRNSFGGRQVDRFLRAAHIAPKECLELDEIESLVELVAKGVGVALVPQTALHRQWPKGVRAIDLGSRTFHRETGIVHRAGAPLREPVAKLMEILLHG